MRVGLFEFGILVVVALVIFMTARLWRMSKSEGKEINPDTKFADSTRKNNGRRRLRFSGIALIVIGIVFLLANMTIFKWVMWSYAWLLALIFIGLILVLLFRK